MGPQEHKVERRLAAIFAADVAGYSRLMSQDEVGTLRNLTTHREIMDRLIADQGGRIANTAGDSVLAEFASAVDAVQCAAQVQDALASANKDKPEEERLQFRIGVHVGDVMVRAGDLLGDGVNIAARLESLAAPGGICISEAAYGYVRKNLPLTFTDLGIQNVKNIEEPIKAFAVGLVEGVAPLSMEQRETLALPDRPSIAVLRFTNLSGDPEQDYFADGVVEDIITSLSRFPRLFVTARNSSFAFQGSASHSKQIGQQLGVRYLLEGSIRKAGARVRITAQLIEAETGTTLWAAKFDGNLTDVFALQDEVTEHVVGLLHPRIERAEIEAASRKRPDSLTAYDRYLRALPLFHSMTREGSDEALRLIHDALALEPRFGAAANIASATLGHRIAQGWATDVRKDMDEMIRLTRLALDADPNDPDALAMHGRALAYTGTDIDGGIEAVDRAVELCPNSASAWSLRGWIYAYAARPTDAVEAFLHAIRLSPLDISLYSTLTGLALAYIQLGRFDAAILASRKALQQNAHLSPTYRTLAAALAHTGRIEEARGAAHSMLRLEPNFTINEWNQRSPWRQAAKGTFVEGLRMAGLPEG
jgi:adenylate cyclase